MKKGMKFIVTLITLIILIGAVYLYQNNFNRLLTGKATKSDIAVTVPVIVSAPTLSILSPINDTYITERNIPLRFSASNYQSIWYHLDNGSNITVSGNTKFNVTPGNHTLYMYANNTDGNLTSKNVTFDINLSKYRVLYYHYKGKGNSTNFNETPFSKLQNLTQIVLENPAYGKISFNEALNVTADANTSDKTTDLDNNTNISSNYIEINTTALPNFNRSATLYLYNLTFSNPIILMDGSYCPSSICTKISYSGGTLKFNVTHFTAYSAEETPSSAVGGSGSGSGGASGETVATNAFMVTPNSLSVIIKGGETIQKIITINNTGQTSKKFTIGVEGVGNLVKMTMNNFTLSPGGSKGVPIDFLAPTTIPPNIYLGKIIVKSGTDEQDVLIGINVGSAQQLFDVSVSIPDNQLTVVPGGNALAEIKLYNLGATGRIDANVEYGIRDQNNNTIASTQKTIAVETQADLLETVPLPSSIPDGKYFFYAKVSYDNKIATAGAFFDVAPAKSLDQIYISVIIGLVILLFIAALIIQRMRFKKIERNINKIGLEDIRKG